MIKRYFSLSLWILFCTISCRIKEEKDPIKDSALVQTDFKEAYRPQFHFSPREKWMNDPNGLVFHQGVYHLFYQYYPDDIVWGPMHWGHAVSNDLIKWEHKEIALYPDENGLIFSGSAVVDKHNSSGFGTLENPPLVAIFTYHLMEGEEAGRNDYQTQGIAYSLDNGESWTKYEGNPVIGNSGIKDFRDPKVFWHEESSKWIMALVAGDHAKFYTSNDLKNWAYESDFGKEYGAHGGVWECPDLFKLKTEGTDEEKWVLIISINPGAPNGGSGTQYFIGAFDGKSFTSNQKEAKWLDHGTDNYAGVTYNNVPDNERIFIGWMSNWDYARDTPTKTWRSAMTLPRKLSLAKVENEYFLKNYPLKQLNTLIVENNSKSVEVEKEHLFSFDNFNQSEVNFSTAQSDFELIFSNESSEELILKMDGENKVFTVNREKSGIVNFEKSFASAHEMAIDHLIENQQYNIKVVLDWSSVEVFINDGQYVMTEQIFPTSNYTKLLIINKNIASSKLKLEDFQINSIKSIWK